MKDVNGLTMLAKDEHMRPETTMQSLAQLQPSFVQMGELGGFDAVAVQAHPEIEAVNHVHHAGNSSGIVDGAAAVLIGSKEAGEPGRPEAAGAHQGVRQYRLGAGDHADRAGRCDAQGARASQMTLDDIDLFEINEAFASVVLRFCRPSTSIPPRSTSTAAPSPWAIRSAPPAR